MELQKKLDLIIKDIISPVFKLNKFKKSARNWYKEENNLGYCFNIQSSLYNDKKEIKYTFNTGLFAPELYSVLENNTVPKFPKEYDCFHRCRIGSLMKKNDYWYTLNNKTIIKKLSKEMELHIKKYIIPHFNKFLSYSDVIKQIYDNNVFIKSPSNYIYIASMLIIEKRKNEAKILLKENYESSKNELYKEKLKQICNKLNIDLN